MNLLHQRISITKPSTKLYHQVADDAISLYHLIPGTQQMSQSGAWLEELKL